MPHPDLTALLKDGQHFAEKRGDRIHIVDSLTGNTHVMYADNPQNLPTKLIQHERPDGTILWIEEGIQPPGIPLQRERTFHPTIIHLLCQRIAEGGSVTEICKEPGFPTYNLLRKWAKAHPWIDEHLETAKRDRAEYYRDKAVREAEDAESRDPIEAHALRVDTYKWAAGMDHERYNPKTKIEATVNAPTQIIVQTGIMRDVRPAPLPEPTGVIPQADQKYEE